MTLKGLPGSILNTKKVDMACYKFIIYKKSLRELNVMLTDK